MGKTKSEIIEILVPVDDPDLPINIDALNFEGDACSLATAEFEKALGKVESKKLKPEFRKKKVKAQRNIKLGNWPEVILHRWNNEHPQPARLLCEVVLSNIPCLMGKHMLLRRSAWNNKTRNAGGLMPTSTGKGEIRITAPLSVKKVLSC